MIRESLSFHNAHRLYFESQLDRILPDSGSNGSLNRIIQKWRDRNIGEIFIFTGSPGGPFEKRLRLFIGAAKKGGIRISRIPVNIIKNNRFDIFLRMNRAIWKRLKSSSGLFLFDGGNQREVFSYAAIFLISLKPPAELGFPEGAIQYLTGRETLASEDFRVFLFKKNIDPSYEIPPLVQRLLQPGKTTDLVVRGEPVRSDGSVSRARSGDSKVAIAEAPPTIPEAPIAERESEQAVAAGPKPWEDSETVPFEDYLETKIQRETAKEPAATAIVEPPVPTTGREQADKPESAEALLVREPVSPDRQDAEAPPDFPEEIRLQKPADFRQARFLTIRNKLLLIISGIITTALGLMIFIATELFYADSAVRIEEYTLKTTELIGQKLESEFENLAYLSLNTATSLLQGAMSARQRDHFVRLFFQNNKDFVFLGVVDAGDKKYNFRDSIVNSDFLKDNPDITPRKLREALERNTSEFNRAFNRTPVVKNISPGLPLPLLGLGLALGDPAERRLVTVVLKPEKITRSIKGRGRDIIKTFVTDNRGDIIAHEDGKLMLAGANVADSPIVRKMMESKLDNEKLNYKDGEGVRQIGFFKKITFAGLSIIATVKEAKAFEAVYNIRRRNMMILVIFVVSAILIVFFFSRTLSVPIIRLVWATRKVESGHFDVHIRPTTHDEIGSLTHSFASMAVGLSEREKMKDAFGKFVNKEIAERVLRGEVKLGGERKECAVFFSDLRGFTAMSEQMSPEQVVEFLNEYFTGMVNCINNTKGVVDKYIGDAIMAHWGAIVSDGKDTENAVNTALQMRKVLIEFNRRGAGKRPFARFGCGINTGPVISGQIGSEERLEYTVIGDTVNLASRIEGLNKAFGTDILISQDSYDQVSKIFKVEPMPAIKVKGKAEPQTIYAVLGHLDDPECPESLLEVRQMSGLMGPAGNLKEFEEKQEDKFEILTE